ncbi:MAG: hypothetical protein ACREM3_19650 [Candidatus Rokuibacteriota bacterium]
MLTLVGLAAIALVPPLLVVALLWLAASVQRRRAALAARQVAVTNAIHRELGAVVAPVAHRRGLGGWELRIAVPLERPELVGPVTITARRALARLDERGADAVPIVLLPRAAARPR